MDELGVVIYLSCIVIVLLLLALFDKLTRRFFRRHSGNNDGDREGTKVTDGTKDDERSVIQHGGEVSVMSEDSRRRRRSSVDDGFPDINTGVTDLIGSEVMSTPLNGFIEHVMVHQDSIVYNPSLPGIMAFPQNHPLCVWLHEVQEMDTFKPKQMCNNIINNDAPFRFLTPAMSNRLEVVREEAEDDVGGDKIVSDLEFNAVKVHEGRCNSLVKSKLRRFAGYGTSKKNLPDD